MANERVKIEPVIIVIPEGRVSFLRTEPTYRTNKMGQPIKTRPDGTPLKPRYSMTWLLDPTNPAIPPVIAAIKAEAARQLDLFFGGRDKWPKDNPTTGTKGILTCWGEGNKLPKVYDGYKDMFYVKVSDTVEPIWGDRRGRSLRFDKTDGAWHVLVDGRPTEETADPDGVPYNGCWARGRISLYVYNNESAGVNANFRSVQFVRPGEAFGGGGRRSADEELEAMAGDAPKASGASEPDPWG